MFVTHVTNMFVTHVTNMFVTRVTNMFVTRVTNMLSHMCYQHVAQLSGASLVGSHVCISHDEYTLEKLVDRRLHLHLGAIA